MPVIAEPAEATALGNVLLQLVGLGELHTLSDVRAVARTDVSATTGPARDLERHGAAFSGALRCF